MSSAMVWLSVLVVLLLALFVLAWLKPVLMNKHHIAQRRQHSTNKQAGEMTALYQKLKSQLPSYDFTIKPNRLLISNNGSIIAIITADQAIAAGKRKLDEVLVLNIKPNYGNDELLWLMDQISDHAKNLSD